jgi:hypothetical protein
MVVYFVSYLVSDDNDGGHDPNKSEKRNSRFKR